MSEYRIERDSMGEIKVPDWQLWGAQTQRSLKYFSIGKELMPEEMVAAYAYIKKAAAIVNCRDGRLADELCELITSVCDEILDHQHADEFPVHVWMTGSGTQFNMNVNEVIANRCSQLAGTELGSHKPVNPNDHVNMSQSTNDSFPTAMCVAAALSVRDHLLPGLTELLDALDEKAKEWSEIVKIGRTHLQDATPLTLGQEFSGYAAMLADNKERIQQAYQGILRLTLGGTAVGTGINAQPGFDTAVAEEISKLTKIDFRTAPNKFAAQGSHDDLAQLSSTLKTLAISLHKIANDIRLLACGPRAGLAELNLPANEPGSSIMPGKVNPTQCEAMAMLTAQVMGNDTAVAIGASGGHLEMNSSKPLIIYNIIQSIHLLGDGCSNFSQYMVKDMQPNHANISKYVERSLMLVTALAPVIGYHKAAEVAHHAAEHDLSLREAAIQLEAIAGEEFDRIVDPLQMTRPYVAK